MAVALFERGFSEHSVEAAVAQASSLDDALKWLECRGIQPEPPSSGAQAPVGSSAVARTCSARPMASGVSRRAPLPVGLQVAPVAPADPQGLCIALVVLGVPVGLVKEAVARGGSIGEALDWLERCGASRPHPHVATIDKRNAQAWWREAMRRWNKAMRARAAAGVPRVEGPPPAPAVSPVTTEPPAAYPPAAVAPSSRPTATQPAPLAAALVAPMASAMAPATLQSAMHERRVEVPVPQPPRESPPLAMAPRPTLAKTPPLVTYSRQRPFLDGYSAARRGLRVTTGPSTPGRFSV